MLKTKLSIFFFTVTFLALPHIADAHTVCVSNDEGALEAALALAEDGDTLLLQGGSYHLEHTLQINKSVKIQGKGKNSIMEGSSNFSGTSLLEITAPEVTVSNVLLTWETFSPSKQTCNIYIHAESRGVPSVLLESIHHIFAHEAIHTELSSVEILGNTFYTKNHSKPSTAILMDSPARINRLCQNTFINTQNQLTACHVSWDLQKIETPLHVELYCLQNVTENSTLRNLLTCDLPIANNKVSLDLYADENKCFMENGSSMLLFCAEDAPSHSGFAAIKNLSITKNQLGETPTALATFIHKTAFTHLLPPSVFHSWKIQDNQQSTAAPPRDLFLNPSVHFQAIAFFHGCYVDIPSEKFGLNLFPDYSLPTCCLIKQYTPAFDVILLQVSFPTHLHPDARAFSIYANNKFLMEVSIDNHSTLIYGMIIPPNHYLKPPTYTLELHHKNLESIPSKRIPLQKNL